MWGQPKGQKGKKQLFPSLFNQIFGRHVKKSFGIYLIIPLMSGLPQLWAIKIQSGNGFFMSNDEVTTLSSTKATVGNIQFFPKDGGQET